MGKNRRTIRSGETPEQFQERYDEAQKVLDEYTYLNNNYNESKLLSQPQIKRLLDTVLDKNTHFVGVSLRNGKRVIEFEERIENPDGTISTTRLNIEVGAYKRMYSKKAVTTIEDLMNTYHDIPVFQRNMVSDFNFGGTGGTGNGGFYSPLGNSVNLNGGLFKTKRTSFSKTQSDWVRHVLNHETTHAVDHNLVKNYMTYGSEKSEYFNSILKTNKGSAYSESYSGWKRNVETLAEAVAVTRMNRLYGNESTKYYCDPEKSYMAGNEIDYNTWSKRNPELADFANKFVDCKNEKELKELFRV